MTDSDIPMIVQARINSSRYPQKILEDFADGLCLLEYQLVRLKKAFPFTRIVVATSTSAADDVIENIARRNNILFFRGDEHNVLERFTACCAHFNFTGHIIRICSDNPFLQLQLLRELIFEAKVSGSRDDYISYSINDIPAIRTHFGFFAEIVKVSALYRLQDQVTDPIHREHVTNYIYEHYESPAGSGPGPHRGFRLRLIELNELSAWSGTVRLTIDSKEDLENARFVYQSLGVSPREQEIPWSRIVALVGKHAEVRNNMKKQIQLHQK
jgi:spore coat polysaccharide biosynthesis protein SpsF (cytidylyltransferase family)